MKASLPVVFAELCVSKMKYNEIEQDAEKEMFPLVACQVWVSMKLLPELCTTMCVCFQMAIIFNQEGLKAVRPPCVIQSFINHNAVLYKVFVVGESYTVVKRPSLKNFSAGISGTLHWFKRKCLFLQPQQETSLKKVSVKKLLKWRQLAGTYHASSSVLFQ